MMFAHQVIEDLRGLNPKYVDTFKGMEKTILQCQKFHIGDAGKLPDMTGEILNFESCKLPYPTCWVDFTASERENQHEFEEHVLMPKRGMIAVQNIEEKDSPIILQIFNFYGKDSEYNGRWIPNIFEYVIISGENSEIPITYMPHALNEDKQLLNKKINKIQSNAHSIIKTTPSFPDHDGEIYGHLTKKKYNEILYGDSQDISTLKVFLNLLSCKNIGTETVPAPVKLNNKRKKAGKQPLFSYKTLVIKPTGKKQSSIPKHLWNNRIHLSRGHFKTYTEEKPLFGKITGRFWWQPHIRGQNRDGVVMKDYKVEA